MTTSASLRSRLLGLAVPTALSNITVPLAGLVDVAMLGHLGELRHLAGVHLATVLFDYTYWSFAFLKMGTQGLTAQAVGRGDDREVGHVLARSLALAVAIALVIVAGQAAIETAGFAALAGTPAVEAAGRDYFDARIWGALAVLPNFVFIGWFLARERSTYVLVMTLVASALNVVLDYIFIYRMQLAAFGAGLATMLAQVAMLATALVLLAREPGSIGRLTRGIGTAFERKAMLRLLTLNRDIMLRTFCLITTFAVFTNVSATFGTLVLAANAVLLKLLQVAAHFIDGIAFATQSLAGIFKGRRDVAILRELLAMSMTWGVGVALGVAVVATLLPTPLYGLLTSHGDLIDVIRTYDGWFRATLLAGALAYVYDGFFIGLTEGRVLRNAMALSTLAGFVPLAVVAWTVGSNHLLWLALLVFMGARVATLGSQRRRVLAPLGPAPAAATALGRDTRDADA